MLVIKLNGNQCLVCVLLLCYVETWQCIIFEPPKRGLAPLIKNILNRIKTKITRLQLTPVI